MKKYFIRQGVFNDIPNDEIQGFNSCLTIDNGQENKPFCDPNYQLFPEILEFQSQYKLKILRVEDKELYIYYIERIIGDIDGTIKQFLSLHPQNIANLNQVSIRQAVFNGGCNGDYHPDFFMGDNGEFYIVIGKENDDRLIIALRIEGMRLTEEKQLINQKVRYRRAS